jgi:hypothetical protein
MIFRVWDVRKDSMFYFDYDNPIFYFNSNTEIHAMLFSFFEDSIGAPIFELDIINVSFSDSPKNHKGYFPKKCQALILQDRDSELVMLTDDTKCPVISLSVIDSIFSYVQVVGNRFQNPKLYSTFQNKYPRILNYAR